MGDRTDIQWTDMTWNPTRGCSPVSAGCANCYAEKVAAAASVPGQPYAGLTTDGRWNGVVRLVPEHLGDPLRLRRPRRIFVDSMSDLFHESLSDDEIAAVFGVMAAASWHTFQVLTKRPERMRAFLTQAATHQSLRERCFYAARDALGEAALTGKDPWQTTFPAPHIHLGVSVEDRPSAERRIPHLLRTPAAVRFISAEPLLGPIDLDDLVVDRRPGSEQHFDALTCDVDAEDDGPYGGAALDWVIVGGESGPGARPCDLAWIRGIVRQCGAAGVPVYVKQLGTFPVGPSESAEALDAGAGRERLRLRDLKGGDPSEWPADLADPRLRAFPKNLPQAARKQRQQPRSDP